MPQQRASPWTKPSRSSTVSRRAVLLAGALLPLSACAILDEASAETPSPPDPDLQLRAIVADAERHLIVRYRATSGAHPGLADSLAEFIVRHERHLAAVLDTAPDDHPAGDRAGDSPAADGPAVARPGGDDDTSGEVEVPASAADAVDSLRTAERDASAERLQDCVAAADYELAQVVASVAACEAAHDRLLRGVG